MMDNADFARSMTSLETYELMVKNYEARALDLPSHRLWFETILRQRDLKRKEARA